MDDSSGGFLEQVGPQLEYWWSVAFEGSTRGSGVYQRRAHLDLGPKAHCIILTNVGPFITFFKYPSLPALVGSQ